MWLSGSSTQLFTCEHREWRFEFDRIAVIIQRIFYSLTVFFLPHINKLNEVVSIMPHTSTVFNDFINNKLFKLCISLPVLLMHVTVFVCVKRQ